MRRLVAALVGAVVAIGFVANVAFADATPIQLVLLYMPNVSNTDTRAASGIAELLMPEGEFRITAADLPRLEGDQQYVAWVVNSESNEFQRLGAFNTAQSSGAVHYENVLPDAIPNKHWNLLLVTVEDSATPPRPSDKHSIAGVFPRADNEPLPVVLPNTGGEPVVSGQWSVIGRADWPLASGLATLTLAIGFSAGYFLSGRRLSKTTDNRPRNTDHQ